MMSQKKDSSIIIHPELKSALVRDVINIFHEGRNGDVIPFEKIREILIERGQLKGTDGAKRWLRDRLKLLRDNKILIDVKLPHKKKAGRPADAYRYNEKEIYALFRLVENLVDAMGFGQLESQPGKSLISKMAIKDGKEYRSLYTPGKGGILVIRTRPATEADLEKTWKLAQHIEVLQNYCNKEDTAYKEYNLQKHVKFMKRIGGGGPSEDAIEDTDREFEEKYGISLARGDTEPK